MFDNADYNNSWQESSANDYTLFGEPISLSKTQSSEKYIGKETDFESGFSDSISFLLNHQINLKNGNSKIQD
jgi:hypothetical protein